MIARKIPMQTVSKSSFARLANYISDTQNKEHRVGDVRITNCISDNIEWAKQEIQATQNKNTRSTSDKTYHLLLSFPSGEILTPKQLYEIEDRFCKALGYGEHQRISAIHTDTDNLHMHIAINKIHPKTYNSYEPFNDYKILSSVCTLVEQQYDLERTNHINAKTHSQNRAQDMERFSGLESMVGWIKRECLEELNQAKSWDELNKVLRESNLYIRVKGNGFVIGDRSSNFEVKASSVDRSLSKPSLENRFGEFTSSEDFIDDNKPKRSYQKEPVYKGRIDTTELYSTYLNERKQFSTQRKDKFKKLKDAHDKKILAAKMSAQFKRNVIKILARGGAKKIAYAAISFELKKKLKEINSEYKANRDSLYSKTRPLIWNDWLKKEAMNGDELAAKVLQQQNFRKSKQYIQGDSDHKIDSSLSINIDSITRRGSFILKTPGIRDVGKRIDITQKSNDESILEALKLAQKKYGNKLKIEGDDLFKQQIVRVAAKSKLNIQFDNAGMERHRQILLKEFINHEQNRRRNQYGDGVSRSGNDSRRNSTTRDGSSVSSRATFSGSTGNRESSGVKSFRRDIKRNESILYAQSNISEFASRAPSEGVHSMPRLSAGNVASLKQRNEVLLQNDAHNHMDRTTSISNERMRWATYFNGLSQDKREAILAYVSERNSKRENFDRVFDISKHIVYNNDVNGDVKFVGLRKVNNQNLVLLQKIGDDTVYVKDVSQREITQLKKASLQSTVNLDSQGKITLKQPSKTSKRGKK